MTVYFIAFLIKHQGSPNRVRKIRQRTRESSSSRSCDNSYSADDSGFGDMKSLQYQLSKGTII